MFVVIKLFKVVLCYFWNDFLMTEQWIFLNVSSNLFNSCSGHRSADIENEDDVFRDGAERLGREGVNEVVVDYSESVEVRLVVDVVFYDELVVEVPWKDNNPFCLEEIGEMIQVLPEKIIIFLVSR